MGRRLSAFAILLAACAVSWWILAGGPGNTGAGAGAGDPAAGAADPVGAATTGTTANQGGSGDGAVLRTPGDAPPDEQPTGALDGADPELVIPSFTGTVLDPQGRPRAGARIEAFGLLGYAVGIDPDESTRNLYAHWTVSSDADGNFRLPEAPREGLRFLVRVTAEDAAPLLLRNLPAQPGRTRPLGELRLDGGATVSGTVLGPDGAPVADAEVQALRESRVGGAGSPPLLTPLEDARTRSDAAGRFQLTRLPADTLRLRARGAGLADGWSAGFPVAAGAQVAGIEVVLSATRGLRGLVRDADGRPVADAALIFLAAQDDPLLRGRAQLASSDAAGRFELRVPAEVASGRLLASAPGCFRWDRAVTLDEVAELEVSLDPLPTLAGRCVDADGRPVGGAEVRLLELRTGTSDPELLTERGRATSAADGSYTLQVDLRGAEALRFLVHARDATGETGTTPRFTLLAADRYRAPELRIVLGTGMRVRGTARREDGAPAAGARLLLRKLNAARVSRLPALDESRRGGLVVARTSAATDGSFAFPGQEVGDYRVEAFLPGASPAESEEFALLEGDHRTEVRLAAPAALVGRVQGPLGELGPLQVLATTPGREPLDATVGADGRFRFDALWPGTWSLEVREQTDLLDVSGFIFGGTEPLARADGLRVVAGRETPVELRIDLAGLGAVEGQARVDGAPAYGHRVFLLPMSAQVDADPRIGARSVMRLLKVAAVQPDGRFRIAGVAPDSYWLVLCEPSAWPEGLWGGGWEAGGHTPAGLARLQVAVPTEGSVAADFVVARGALRIVVTNGDREILPSDARLVPLAEGVRSHGFRIGAAGVRVAGLPAGDYRLELAAGTLRSSVQASVPAGAEGVVEVQLAEPGMRPQRPPGVIEEGGR